MKRRITPYTVRRSALTVVAIAALATATSATSAAIEGNADAGVVFDAVAATVTQVSPTGFAWRDGVRAGQHVVEVEPANGTNGWRLVTDGSNGLITSSDRPIVAALRAQLPFALFGLAAAVLAVVYVRTNRDWVLPSACLALVASSPALFFANQSFTGFGMGAAAAVPALWAAWRVRRWRRLSAVVAFGAAILVALWYFDWTAGSVGTEVVEPLRRGLALGGAGLLIVDRSVETARRHREDRMSRTTLLAIAAGATLLGAGLALIYLGAFPAPVVVVFLVLALLAVPPLRTFLGRRLEDAVLADLREHVAAEVADEERARLARELHDAPLQQLAAAIRGLELVPEARGHAAPFHEVADELRAVTSGLRPPMLDDIGLGAALDFLADKSSSATVGVQASIRDTTGIETEQRPPQAVELSMFRIAQEAVGNALQHSGAHAIQLSATISRDAVDMEISDDGAGIEADAARGASRRGRLGLASMQRRAQAIHADFSIEGSRGGTKVRATWRR